MQNPAWNGKTGDRKGTSLGFTSSGFDEARNETIGYTLVVIPETGAIFSRMGVLNNEDDHVQICPG